MPQVAFAAAAAGVGAVGAGVASGAAAASAAAVASGVAISSTMAIGVGFANLSLAAVVTSTAIAAGGAALQLATQQTPKALAPNITVRQAVPILSDIYGRARVGGAYALYHAGEGSSGEKRNFHAAIVFAAHVCDAVEEIYAGDELVWTAAGGVTSDYAERIGRVVVHLGGGVISVGTRADLPTTLAGAAGTNFKLAGRCWVEIKANNIAKRWQSIPQFWAVVRGKKVLDPRDGVTRWTDNWALCFADYLRTRGRIPADQIDEATLIAAANLSDENVAKKGGGTVKRYRMNGAFQTDAAARSTLPDWLRQGGNLRGLIDAGDRLMILPGAYSAPVAAYGPDDYRGPLTIEGETLVEDRWDGVAGTYTPAASNYNATEFERIVLNDYTGPAADARILELDYTREPEIERAQRLALLALRQSRRYRRVSVALKLTPETVTLIPGQRVTLTLDPIGLSGVFEIVSARTTYDAAAPRVDIVALEDSPDFWTWLADTATDAPPTLGGNLSNPRVVEPPVGPLLVVANRRIEPDGTTTRWLAVDWGDSPDRLLDEYEVRWTQGGRVLSQRVTASNFDIYGASASAAVTVEVYAVNTLGILSPALTAASVTPGGDVTPPAIPPSGSITPLAGGFRFVIGRPIASDLASLRLYEGAAGATFAASTAVMDVSAVPGPGDAEFQRLGLAPNVTRRYYVTARDRSGNESAAFGPLQSTTPTALSPAEIDAAISDAVTVANNAQTDATQALEDAAAAGLGVDQLQTDVTALSVSFAAGQGANLARNTEFALGTDYWTALGAIAPEYDFSVRFLTSSFSGVGEAQRPLVLYRNPNSVDQFGAIMNTTTRVYSGGATELGVNCAPGEWVEISANIGATNCAARLRLRFRDNSGTSLSSAQSDEVATFVGNRPDLNARLWVSGLAPTGTARVGLELEMLASTNTASAAAAVMLRPMITQSSSGATAPQPYAPGAAGDVGVVDAYYRQSVGILAADGLAVAQAVESQGARLDDAEADITTISTTKVDANGAVAAVNSAINAVAGTSLATIQQLTTAQAELDGDVRALNLLTVQANGAVATQEVGAVANTGSFIRFRADRTLFYATDPTLGAPILSIDAGGVRINGTLLLNGSTLTEALSANAVTESLRASSNTDLSSGAAQTWTPVATYTTPGGLVLWKAQVRLKANVNNSDELSVRLIRNNATMFTYSWVPVSDNEIDATQNYEFNFVSTSASLDQVWTFEVRSMAPEAARKAILDYHMIDITVWKR